MEHAVENRDLAGAQTVSELDDRKMRLDQRVVDEERRRPRLPAWRACAMIAT